MRYVRSFIKVVIIQEQFAGFELVRSECKKKNFVQQMFFIFAVQMRL